MVSGVAVVSPTKERSKRYAQEPQGPQRSEESKHGTAPSELGSIFNGISNHYERIRSRLENPNPISDWLTNIEQLRNGSDLLDGFLRRMNATWNPGFFSPNAQISARDIQLLRLLLNLRNTSSSDVRTRIDRLLRRFFSDVNQRISSSNMTIPSQVLQELGDLIRQRIEQDRNGIEGLERLLHRIHLVLRQRNSNSGRIPSKSSQTSGGGSVSSTGSSERGRHLGGAPNSGDSPSKQSGSGSGSAESGDRSGGTSSGSGESGTSS